MPAEFAKFDLVVLGEIVWEHRVRPGSFPAPGGKSAYRSTELKPTGVAALCLQRAKKGQQVALAAVIGDDERDKHLLGQLEAAGVNLAALVRRHGAAPVERWVFEEEGDCCTTLAEEASSYPAEAISPDWVASGRELWVDERESAAAQRAIKLAHKAGVPVHSLAGLGIDHLHCK